MAIVGRGADKRSLADALVRRARDRGLSAFGFVSEPHPDGEVGFELVGLADDGRWPLATTAADGAGDTCGLAFDPATFERVLARVQQPWRLCVLDAGKLEARGRGGRPAIDLALSGEAGAGLVVLLLRPDYAAPIAMNLPDPVGWLELPADDAACERLIEDALTHCGRQ